MNYGIIALLVNKGMSARQKEGWIEEAWHLSHLCGNWICCNWRHHTVEDGPTNCSRKYILVFFGPSLILVEYLGDDEMVTRVRKLTLMF